MSYRDSQRFRKVYGYFRPVPRATDTSTYATQQYVDDVVAGIDWKQSVRVATTGNINLSSPGAIDGITLANEDRVLVKSQSSGAENGIYIYNSTTGVLTRTLDAEQDTLTSGAAVYVEEGTDNNGTAWILSTPDPITVGSTSQSWVLFSTIYPVFIKSGSYARSTVDVSFGNQYTNEIGSDVFFYVSGTIGTAASQNISVFGGDVVFSGSLVSKLGLSGSLTKLADGTSYLIAGSNITITSASNGSITISSTATGGPTGGDPNAQYLVLSATGSLSAERVLTVGTGISGSDGGAGNGYTLSIDSSVVATVSGTTFTGATKHNAGLSGSLTKLTDGTSYLVAGSNVTITSASNGSVTISAAGTAPGGTDTQVQFNDGGSALGGDTGLTYNKNTDTLNVVNIAITATDDQVWKLKDNSAGALNIGTPTNNYWTFNTGDNQERLGFWDGVRASFGDINDPDLNIQHDGTNSRIENKTGQLILSSASGITVSGSTKFLNGLSGSLTQLSDGTSFLIAGSGISISTGSTGAITISNDGTIGDITAVNAGTGLSGGGTSGSVTLNIDNAVVATVSGTTFTGVTKHNAGLSGSLTKLTDGSSYLVAGSNVTITSASNGSVTISAAGTAPGGIDTQVQFNDGGSALGGDAGLTYTKSTDTLNVVNVAMTATNDQVWQLKDNSAGALNLGAGGSNYWTFNTGDGQERLGFWDGVRASFGDINDPDLNIQHDGTNSRIENKTGQLILSSASGITASGSAKFLHGLSGSLTKLSDGTSYLIAGSAISISSASNGAITISSTAVTSPGGSNTYVQFNDSGSFGGVAGFTFEKANNSLNITGGLTGSNARFSNITVTGTASISFLETVNQQSLVIGDKYITILSGAADHTSLDGSGILFGSGSTGPTVDVLGANAHILYRSANDALEIFPGLIVSGALKVTQNASITGSLNVSGSITAAAFSGSLTKLSDGTSYLIAGNNVTITTGANGAVTIASTATSSESYFSSTTAGSIFTTGSAAFRGGQSSIDSPRDVGLDVFFYVSGSKDVSGSTANVSLFGGDLVTSGSANIANGASVVGNLTAVNNIGLLGDLNVMSDATIAGDIIGDNTLTVASGSTLNGTSVFNGVARFNSGLSGSLTKLTDGSSYLIAGSNVTITTGTNGAVTIAATAGSGTPGGSNTQVQFNDGGSTFGGDAEFTYNKTTNTLSVNNLSGSLTKLTDGTSYIIAGTNMTITTGSNGAITIDGPSSGAPTGAQYLVLQSNAGLDSERVLSASTGLLGTDAGPNSTYTLVIDNSVVATVSGTRFIGTTRHSAGLISSGSTYFTGSVIVTGSLTISGSQAFTAMRGNENTTSTTAIDWNNGNVQKFTLNSNPTTFTFSNGNAGGTYMLIIRQNSGGSYTINWPGAVSWPGGTNPTMTTGSNKHDIYSFVYDGSTYFGAVNQNYT